METSSTNSQDWQGEIDVVKKVVAGHCRPLHSKLQALKDENTDSRKEGECQQRDLEHRLDVILKEVLALKKGAAKEGEVTRIEDL